jgi:hypothetical protein
MFPQQRTHDATREELLENQYTTIEELLETVSGKLFKIVILQIVQRNTEESLLHASQVGFRPCLSTPLQHMKLMDHVSLNFNNNMYMAAVFLDIEKKPLIQHGI